MNEDLMRLRIDLAYDGSNFNGWAKQRHLRTVQGEIEAGLTQVLRLPAGDHFISAEHAGMSQYPWVPQLVVAGRTDTGVHAAHQVCHLDIPRETIEGCVGHLNSSPVQALEHRLQHVLPRDIAIHRISVAAEGFDARFSALERTYIYRICDNLSVVDPRMRPFVLNIDGPLDIETMNVAAASIVGLHDFGSFARANPGGTTIRKVKYAHWERVSNSSSLERTQFYQAPILESGLVCFTIVADAFAHNMVRSLVNACLRVGLGKQDLEWFKDKVAQPVREGSTGPVAACGLSLEHVAYPPDNQLASRAQAIRAKRTL